MTGPFHVEKKGPFLFAALDTPDAMVNILTPQAIAQLQAIIAEIDPRETRALVLTSKKPRSFLNGARLVLAAALRSPEHAAAAASMVRPAYEAVAASPVPVIAAIAGTCYGCGLELVLACDYRVVSDTYDTDLYLTEVADYLLTPVFGSCRRLPPLVGVETAVDMLLWGRHVRGAQAVEIGLADAVLARASFDEELDAWLADFAARGFPRPARERRSTRSADAATAWRTRETIAKLPREVRDVYRRALARLLPGPRGERTKDRELESFALTITRPEAAEAMGFFFVRQVARRIGSGNEETPSVKLEVAQDLAAWRRVLEARRLFGVELVSGEADMAFGAGDLALVVGGPWVPGQHGVYLPFGADNPTCELIMGERDASKLIELFGRLGFEPVVSRGTRSVADRLRAAGPDLAAAAAEGVRCLDDGSAAHPAQVDLLAHRMLQLPLHEPSLLRRVDADESLRAEVAARVGPGSARMRAVQGGRGFYGATRARAQAA